MKRIGNLYDKVYDIENLRLAHNHAKCKKGWYVEVQMVDANLDYYLNLLHNMLKNKTYRTSEYKTFIKKEHNKERVIYKLPYFPDRICHWAILLVIDKYLIRNFTINTYSAIPKRGTLMGLKRITSEIEKDPEGCQYCLKLDVSKYYPSIDHDILKQKYARLFKDKDLLWLIGEIIDSTEKGIPIGNYLSQFSGNLYLSGFDHWIKEVKHIKYYHRYMDDVIVLHHSKEFLHQLRKEINEYFVNELKLKMKPNWQIFPSYVRGIDFLGYRIFKDYILLRKTTCKNMKAKVKKMNYKIKIGKPLNYSNFCSYNSYKGIVDICNGFRLKKKYLSPLQSHMEEYYETNLKNNSSLLFCN